MDPMLNIAVRAARAAGDIIVRAMDRVDLLNITLKSRNDFVSDIDRQAEHEIVSILLKAYPHHAVHGEEHGEQGTAGSEYVWVIDPLDGTTNFLHGVPIFAISIALEREGQLVSSVVFNPIADEMFIAEK